MHQNYLFMVQQRTEHFIHIILIEFCCLFFSLYGILCERKIRNNWIYPIECTAFFCFVFISNHISSNRMYSNDYRSSSWNRQLYGINTFKSEILWLFNLFKRLKLCNFHDKFPLKKKKKQTERKCHQNRRLVNLTGGRWLQSLIGSCAFLFCSFTVSNSFSFSLFFSRSRLLPLREHCARYFSRCNA